ncbi:MAG: UDP-N-acetylglucosamine 2-epimerase, partial [bacterium]|nr:UDP-N-acetylglucosamine 2-epimerase [bacterium]
MKKNRRKICVVTANRADFSRLETVLESIDEHPNLDLQLIVMGSHLLDKAGYTIREIENKGFTVNQRIFMEIAGETPTTMAKSVGLAMIELSTAFDYLKPDLVLTHGDRYEALAVGTTAAMMNIHVGHIQGGEVSGNIDESVRHALTKFSHLHFVSTEKSRERVIKMGEDPDTVFNTGCPGTDLLLRTPKKDRFTTLKQLIDEVIQTKEKLNPALSYILMIQHPVTTEHKSAGSQILETLNALQKRREQLIILWPNIDAGADNLSQALRKHSILQKRGVIIFKHLPSHIFINVLRNAACIVGNSSSGIREACYFGTPVVNIGSRQDNRERGGNVVDMPYLADKIFHAIKNQIMHGVYPVEQIFGDGMAGKKLTDIFPALPYSFEGLQEQKRVTFNDFTY